MEKLKGLILSGGAGTRLRPITHTSAKQLVPVANKPVLFYGIEALVDAGVTEIGIVIAPQTGDEIRAAVGDGSQLGAEVTYIPQAEPLGLAHAVLTAEEFLGDDSFVMYLGDNLLRDGITGLVEAFRRNEPDALILLTQVLDPEHYGVAELDGERIVRLVEKPTDPPSDLALVGVYMFTPEVLARGEGDRALRSRRARDHRHDPAPDRHRPHRRAAPGQGLVEGHRPARRHARGQPARARRPRAPRRRRAGRLQGRGPRGDRAGSPGGAQHRPRPRGDRRRQPGHRFLRRPLHRDRRPAARSPARRSSTRSCSPARSSATCPRGWRRACSAVAYGSLAPSDCRRPCG